MMTLTRFLDIYEAQNPNLSPNSAEQLAVSVRLLARSDRWPAGGAWRGLAGLGWH